MPAAHANRPRIMRPVNLDLKRRAAAGTKWCHNEADLAPTISTKPPGNIHRRITSAVMGGKHSVHSSVQSALHHAANYTAEHRARCGAISNYPPCINQAQCCKAGQLPPTHSLTK